jgi:hypothetical protein
LISCDDGEEYLKYTLVKRAGVGGNPAGVLREGPPEQQEEKVPRRAKNRWDLSKACNLKEDRSGNIVRSNRVEPREINLSSLA